MKVLTFGEIMLRLTPSDVSLLSPSSFRANFGGSESNVAVSLSCLGEEAYFLTKLPDNEIAKGAIHYLEDYRVNASRIVKGGDRLGIYFYLPRTKDSAPRSIYDRKYSSLSLAKREDFDWDSLLEGINWFHFSGITAALSKEMPLILLDALKTCKRKNITVSLDVNYRSNLWSKEEAKKVMHEFMPYVQVCIANEEEAAIVFQEKENGTIEDYASAAFKENPNLKIFTSCWRDFQNNHSSFSAVLFTKEKEYHAENFPVNLKEDIGGGDAYCAGLIKGILEKKEGKDLVDFASAAGALKYSILGDSNTSTYQDIENFVKQVRG